MADQITDPPTGGTVIDLGKKVKAKYPQYANLSDEEVGRKVKAKYPDAYGSFADVPSFPKPLQPMTTPAPGAAEGGSSGGLATPQAAQPPIGAAPAPTGAQATPSEDGRAGMPESVQSIRLDEAGDVMVDMPEEFLTPSQRQETTRTLMNHPDPSVRQAANSRLNADREVRKKMDRIFAQKQEDRKLVDQQVSGDLQFSLQPQEVPSLLPEGQGPATALIDPRDQKVRGDYMKSLSPEEIAYKTSKKEQGAWTDRDAFDEDVSSLAHAMNVLDARERRLLRKSEFRKAQQQTDALGDVMYQDNDDVMAEAKDIDLGREYVMGRLATAVQRHPEYAREEIARRIKTLDADVAAKENPMAYNVVQPIRFAIDKFATSLLTTPRTFGSAEYGLTDQMAEWAERSMEDIRAEEPTAFRGGMLEDGAVHPERIMPKVVETLGQAALLMGTSPTRPALLASAFVQSNGDYYNEARRSKMAHAQAQKFAWGAAALTSALEMASPNDAARQMVSGTLRREILDGLEQGLTTKQILARASRVAAKEALPEMGQEGGQYLGDKGAAYLANRILGADRLDDQVKFSEFTENAVLGGVVGGLAGGVPEAIRLASISETAANPQKVAQAAAAMGDEKAAEKVQRIVSIYDGNDLSATPPEKAAKVADVIMQKGDIEKKIKEAPMDPVLEAATGDPRKKEVARLTSEMIEAMGIPQEKAKAALAGTGLEKAPEGTKVVTNPDGSVTLEKKPEAGEKKKPVAEKVVASVFTEEPTGVEEPTGTPTGVPEGGGAVTPEVPIEPTTNEGSKTTPKAAAAQATEDTGAAASVPPAPEPAAAEPVATDLTEDLPDDPKVLADAYLEDHGIWNSSANPEYAMINAMKGRVKESSYDEWGDPSDKGGQMAKTYFAKKGEKGWGLDQIAQELTEELGREVAPDELAELMRANQSGLPRTSPRMRQIAERYKALTGKLLTSATGARQLKAKGRAAVKEPEVKDFIDQHTDQDGNVNWQGVKDNIHALGFLGYTDEQIRNIEAEADRQLAADAGGGAVLEPVREPEAATGQSRDEEREVLALDLEIAKEGLASYERYFKRQAESLFDKDAVESKKRGVTKAAEPSLFEAEGDTRANSAEDMEAGAKTLRDRVALAEKALADYDAQAGAREKAAAQQTSIDQAPADNIPVSKPEKAMSSASRFRPRKRVEFDTPIKGPSGAVLKAYEWQYEFEEYIDDRGEERVRRVSDWNKAELSDETGRDIVHQFEVVTPDGLGYLVSAESALKMMGYMEANASVKSKMSAAKALAGLLMNRQVLQEEVARRKAVEDEVDSLQRPEMTKEDKSENEELRGFGREESKNRINQIWRMGDASIWASFRKDDPLLNSEKEERAKTLVRSWKDNRLKERGVKPYENPSAKLREVEKKIATKERQLGAKATDVSQDTPTTGAAEAAARRAAAILERSKLKGDQLYALPLPPSVWNGAIAAMQEVIVAGGKAVDAIAAAIKHIQESDWWKSRATQKEKDEVTSYIKGKQADLERSMAEEDEQGPQAPPPTAKKEPSAPKEVKKTFTTIRAYEGEFREEVRAELKKGGLYRDIENQEEAEAKADAFIAKVGIEAALDAAKAGDVRGGARSVILGRALEGMERAALAPGISQEEIVRLNIAMSDLTQWVSQNLTWGGQEASMMGRIYQTSDLGFNSEVKANEWRKEFGEEPSPEMMAKWKERDKEFAILKKRLAELEKKTADTRQAQDAEIKDLTQKRDKAQEEYRQLQSGGGDKGRLEAAKKLVKKTIEDLERRLRERDFSKQQRKSTEADKELMDLKVRRQKLRDEYDIEFEKERLRNRTIREKVYDTLMDLVGVPKSLLSSVDFSAPMRQGLILSAGNPRAAGRATAEMFRQAFSQGKADYWIDHLKQTEAYRLMKQSGLYIAEPNAKITAKEENFVSNIAERIPVLGPLVRGSNRAYSGYLNKLRADVFMYGANEMMAQGLTPESNPNEYREWAKFINNATGRGELYQSIESAAPLLNNIFFSPRYIASRFNLLNPVKYIRMPKETRKMAMRNMISFVGFYALIAAILGAAGADEEEDPRDTDFGKFTFGNTRYDMLAGFAQPIRLLARLITGQTSKDDVVRDLDGNRFPFQTRGDVLLDFARTKLSPTAGVVADLMTGEDMVGNPATWDRELVKLTVPLYLQDIKAAYEDGGPTGVIASAVPALFGIGVQTYGKNESGGQRRGRSERRPRRASN